MTDCIEGLHSANHNPGRKTRSTGPVKAAGLGPQAAAAGAKASGWRGLGGAFALASKHWRTS